MFFHSMAVSILVLTGLPLLAAEPAPATKLKATQSELRLSQQRAAELEKNTLRMEAELRVLQEKLVALAELARKREEKLLDLDEQRVALAKKTRTAQADLESRRAEVSLLIASLIRLSRTPPEAVVAMPGDLRKTLQAATVLQEVTQRLQMKAGGLMRKLSELQRVHEALERNRRIATEEKKKAEETRKALADRLHERKKLFAKLGQQQTQERSKIAALLKQSQSLQQLMDRLEKQRRQQAAPPPPAVPAKPPQTWPAVKSRPPLPEGKFSSFAAARGHLPLPVAGRITQGYGKRLRQNQTNRGITIASREGNAVLAPYKGEVVFTGPFLDYGQMVILRYDNDYYLLLAGFSEIHCATGQRVVSGEPLGRLGGSKSNPGALYLELRARGKPTDPTPWFG